MSKTRVIIVRHGQTEYNRDHKLDGQFDTKLTDLGRDQARVLAEFLANEEIDITYSSPLSRSVDTADAITAHHPGIPYVQVDAFREIDCGKCTSLTQAEVKDQFPDLVAEWPKNTDPPFPGGESLKDVEARAVPTFIDIVNKNVGKTVLIVGHGALNIAILGHYLSIPHGLRFKLKQSNCCVNEIEIDEDDFKIIRINYTA